MNKLIIDVASEKIFLMIITNNDIYNIIYENTKINYEKLTTIINDFLKTKNLEIKNIKDMRNYKVKYEKAKTVLGFNPKNNVETIVDQLLENTNKEFDFENDIYYNIRTFMKGR